MDTRSTRLDLEVPPERHDELVAELWELGTNGIEVIEAAGSIRLEAYFAPGEAPRTEDVESAVKRCDAVLTGAGWVESRDWLADYRSVCEPITIGPLVIDPREPEDAARSAGSQEGVLRIPARNAFGTGSHESTRLILEALLETDVEDRSVLDVGTGSAILALAALRRGARRVVGFDIDVGSVVTARDNARLNDAAPALLAGTVTALRGEFDLILVNILPHRWLEQSGAVAALLAEDGEMLVSGVLSTEAEGVVSKLEALGLRSAGSVELGEWTALRLRRPEERAR